MSDRRGPHPVAVVGLLSAVVVVPLVIALVDLHGQRWYPVLDLAITELRVRDVGGRHTPLIGLPGRIGEYPEQGSHPGPLSFAVLSPTYRLLGSSAWALQVATVMIHTAAIVTSVAIGWRRAGWRGALGVAALLAVVVRGNGQLLLTQPWNPYLPLLAWVVVLLATWSVLCGDRAMLVPLVVAASLCAQTHVPYLLLGAALAIGALALAGRRRFADGAVVAAVLVGAVLWLPPLIDQVNGSGNLGRLVEHFGDPPEDVLGLPEGARVALRHLDVWAGFAGFTGDVEGAGRFVSSAATWRGAITVAAWLAAVVVARRVGPPALRRLHAVIAAALVLGVVSMARIFGLPWYYLTLWAWTVTALVLAAIAWTVIAAWRATGVAASRLALPVFAGAVLASSTVVSAVTFADAEVPEARLSRAVGELAGPTYDAIVNGVGAASGPDGRYQVRWSDAADIGSPAFGLFDELERRGLDVRADEYFAVPITEHRVAPREEAVAQVHLATGVYVERWRDVPAAVEVASYEPRSSAGIERYETVRRRLLARLALEGRDDVAVLVDTNLFGAALDRRISADDLDDVTELLALGQPMSVFIAPPGSEPAEPGR